MIDLVCLLFFMAAGFLRLGRGFFHGFCFVSFSCSHRFSQLLRSLALLRLSLCIAAALPAALPLVTCLLQLASL